MKSSTLIVSYLWKDTWSRWLEQPSSALARLFVGALLVTVATVILVALALLERGIRDRLDRFGLNTLVVREMIPASDPELLHSSTRPDRLAPLVAAGQKLRLRQLFVRAQTEWQNEIQVMTYPPEALPIIGRWLSLETPLVLLSDKLPEQIPVQVNLSRQSGNAVVRHLDDYFRPMANGEVLLVPQGWAPEAERMGYVDTTLFQRGQRAFPMQRYVEAVDLVFAMDRRPSPQVQSPLPLIRELEKLQHRQKEWRSLLAGILGMAVALVYGAIAVLEFRQNLFIGALLRSLGAPSRYLYFRQWAENALLINAAALVAMAVVAAFHRELFGTLGFPATVLDLSKSNPYWSAETGLILLWVNAGAFLSSLPVAVGLRRPVGMILN